MDSLKREQEGVIAVRQNEQLKKNKRLQNKHALMEQMQKLGEKRKTDKQVAQSTPHIFGNQGYPPIYEPSIEQRRDVILRAWQRQKEALIEQVTF